MSSRITFVGAGAGSGKTYRLTEIVREALATGSAQPAGVMATTFTIKAATELRERVRKHLLGKGLHSLATEMGQARIGTVNGVCGALLSRFAFEAGLPPEQQVLDERRASQVLKEAMDWVTEPDSLRDFMTVVNRLGQDIERQDGEIPWQKAFRDIVSGARANAILPERLRTLGEKNADTLLGHFGTPTARDLDKALLDAIDTAVPAIEAHQRATAKPFKNTSQYLDSIVEVRDRLHRGDMAWSQWAKLSKEAPEKKLHDTAQPVADIAGEHAQHPKLHSDLRHFVEELFRLASKALAAYEQRKMELGAIDFTDQESLLLKTLGHPTVRETLAEELELLLVDEFQDTSPIQLALFLELAKLAKKVVWVGDIKQAIYGFRGGDTVLMQSVVGNLAALGGERGAPLDISYRSRPALVNWVNASFEDAFKGMTPDDVRLKPSRREATQNVPVEDWRLEGKAEEQHAALASGIAQLLQERYQVIQIGTEMPRPVELRDIAILARSNKNVKTIAAALRSRGVPTTTAQPGLLGLPEIVLALACLRRVNDPRDTLATAEVVSLAFCEDPDDWLSDRLAWLDGGRESSEWRTSEGNCAPLFESLQAIRTLRPTLSPAEAIDIVMARCGIARIVLQWQGSADRGKARLANLEQLRQLAVDYEESCRSGREAATMSGFLLWLGELKKQGEDPLPHGRGNAVQVMTHHAAKGLEWPVVILVDLSSKVYESTWDSVRAESLQAFDATEPLRERFLRYWPWPYGQQQNVPVREAVSATPEGIALRGAAVEEHKRLLYVSMTRARDLLVIARPTKTLDGEWMATIGLATQLDSANGTLALPAGVVVPFKFRSLTMDQTAMATVADSEALKWFARPGISTSRTPLYVSPSSAEEIPAHAGEQATFGTPVSIPEIADRATLGEAVHACLAVELTMGEAISEAQVTRAFAGVGLSTPNDLAGLRAQFSTLRAWLASRWPGAETLVELPVTRTLANGQVLSGRIDLLLRTADGWILFDHKSTEERGATPEVLAHRYGGQLAAYSAAVVAATGLPVISMWLLLPLAGRAIQVIES